MRKVLDREPRHRQKLLPAPPPLVPPPPPKPPNPPPKPPPPPQPPPQPRRPPPNPPSQNGNQRRRPRLNSSRKMMTATSQPSGIPGCPAPSPSGGARCGCAVSVTPI